MISVNWLSPALCDRELNQFKKEIARRFGTGLLGSGKVTFVKPTTFSKDCEGK
jgi:hypothetical protein